MGILARHQSSRKCRWHHTDASLDTQSSDCSWKDWQQPELKRTGNSGDSGTRLVGTQMLLLLGKTLAAADGVKHPPTPTAFDPAVPLLAAFHLQRKWEQTCMYTRTHTHTHALTAALIYGNPNLEATCVHQAKPGGHAWVCLKDVM